MGRKQICCKGHPRARKKDGFILEHILIAEKALGKYLPEKVVVHHHTQKQLVICENQKYHMLLHQRMRAIEACGVASRRKCVYCKEYDDPENLSIHPNGHPVYHLGCLSSCRKSRTLAALEAVEA